MNRRPAIEVQALRLGKRYGDRVAVHDLSFSLKPGKITGFLGPNGARKTTTMQLMLGLVGLSSVANKQPGSFSLGMAQHLGLAQALLGIPAC
jgi:ABC-type multidrug transport system ATPase subunit